MTKRHPWRAFGKHQHKGVSGTSILVKGVHKRTAQADPHAVVEVKGEHKPIRRVRLRKEPLDE